ncbi:MAG: hypothetical protein E6527_03210 [Mixta calida]|nr:hypothetical protein [Mixta calida]
MAEIRGNRRLREDAKREKQIKRIKQKIVSGGREQNKSGCPRRSRA